MTPDVAWQPSLLDGGEPRIDVSYDGLRRIELDARSWVDYCPGWLAGSDSVFEVLAREARWQQRTVTMWDKQVLEPRLTAGWSTDAAHVPPLLAEICRLLSQRYDVGFDSVWVNLYRDGRDSVAWHGDRNRLVMDEPMVATVSLGARRRFLLRRRGSSRIAHELAPGAGDLVVMGGACQQEWEHTVPKTARAVGARMAVTIRHSQPHRRSVETPE
ncbi:MAG TPA: alpha-ketoglutarate-dependent dioxygenase AlkB [Mycobacteriales bacterium]|nr:alpha-ketoglutarate-dependent dioxygenase AlkB [Mycobacteriales bacterium]